MFIMISKYCSVVFSLQYRFESSKKIINCLKLTDRFLKIRHSFAPNGSIEHQNVTYSTPTKIKN